MSHNNLQYNISGTQGLSPSHSYNISSEKDTNPWSYMHLHWQQYPPPPYAYHVTVAIFMLVILMVAIIGNFLTIVVILKFKSLRTSSNILVVNLALSDMLMAASNFPIIITASFYGYWPFSTRVCEIYGFTGGAFGLLSINTLAGIGINRYLVIVKAPSGNMKQEYRWSILMVAASWIYSFCWAVPPLFGWNRYTWEGFGTSCSFDYLTKTTEYISFIWGMFTGGFVVPLLVIMFCYISIYATVLNHRKKFVLFSNELKARVMCGSKERKTNFDVKAAKAAFLCIIMFCISWTPYAVVALLGVLTDGNLITPTASALPGIIAKCSTIYNPIIYAISHPRFKNRLRILLHLKPSYKDALRSKIYLHTREDSKSMVCVSGGSRKNGEYSLCNQIMDKPQKCPCKVPASTISLHRDKNCACSTATSPSYQRKTLMVKTENNVFSTTVQKSNHSDNTNIFADDTTHTSEIMIRGRDMRVPSFNNFETIASLHEPPLPEATTGGTVVTLDTKTDSSVDLLENHINLKRKQDVTGCCHIKSTSYLDLHVSEHTGPGQACTSSNLYKSSRTICPNLSKSQIICM